MFELYLRCPTTGEPVYAGFQSNANGSMAPDSFMEISICAACGATHEWSAAAVWSAIPVTLSPDEAPAFELPPEAPVYEAPSFELPLYDAAWPKVA